MALEALAIYSLGMLVGIAAMALRMTDKTSWAACIIGIGAVVTALLATHLHP